MDYLIKNNISNIIKNNDINLSINNPKNIQPSTDTIKVLTNSFKPLIEKAYSIYNKDNFNNVLKKIESNRTLLVSGKSEFDLIQQKYFRNNFSNSNSPIKSPLKSHNRRSSIKIITPIRDADKKRKSFLIENKIINNKDVLNNPCNRNLLRICKTPDNPYNKFFEKETNFKFLIKQKTDDLRKNIEQKELDKLKPSPGIGKGSIKILKKQFLDQTPPLYLRFKQVAEEKNIKIQNIKKNLTRENSNNIFYDTNNKNTIHNNDTSILSNNSNNKGFGRSKSFNGKEFNCWLETRNRKQNPHQF